MSAQINPWRVPAVLLQGSGSVTYVDLPEGKRLICLARDFSPVVVNIDQPGRYRIQADALAANAGLSVLVVTVHCNHVGLWLELTDKSVNRMIAHAERAAAAVHAKAGHA